ncbi:hypothetical protein [Lentibacter algarum]|jgi:hypothetical protein|uniref:hypothetical protein n=1 Tax=Lentibacter algarum TaxID=576131 RepID=UPI0023551435|nr:hypothetical protein [Lentibacter algarum]MCH9825468.1 hypothetical protein [Alphaproteobacteria bacterium]MCO4827030.1 hypothetical protein [Lentibacter algarum]
MSQIIASFPPARSTYIREHILLAALGSLLLSGVLFYVGNPHPWTGIVGSVLAIGARGAYAMSEQLGMVWKLSDTKLIGPDERVIPLANVADARTMLSALQVVTQTGDKYLIKYQADPAAGASLILKTRDAALSARS